MITPLMNDTGRDVFCGPTSIAVLTGLPASTVEAQIRRDSYWYRRRPTHSVRRMYTPDTLKVLRSFGCKPIEHEAGGMTLRQFCEDRAHMGDFLVRVPGHLLVVSQGMIACTKFNGGLVKWQDYPRLRRRVDRWWRFDPNRTVRQPAPLAPKPPRAPKPKPDPKMVARDRAQAALKRWESRRKRAETAIKKLKRRLAYYERALAA